MVYVISKTGKTLMPTKRYDKALHNKQERFVYDLRSSGYFDLRELDGTKVHASASWKKVKGLESAKTMLTERRSAFPLRLIEDRVSTLKV